MTAEEIKKTYTMTEIVERYGFKPDRSGFIRCPFHHGDRTASLKIYRDSFYCFGCGASGDIFKFVMLMDGVSFKDAFLSLGGHYEHAETKNEARHRTRDLLLAERKRKEQEDIFLAKKKAMHEIGAYLSKLVAAEKVAEPLSDEWCFIQNELPITYEKWLLLWEEVNKTGTSKN